ncbi:MAG: HDIG domain-containing protein [Anaerolineaceae bacterium]|nr:HDIG domain-containing protein [Anaerolineaceae bacterium]
MTTTKPQRRANFLISRYNLRFLIYVVFTIIVTTMMVYPIYAASSANQISIGEVSDQDVHAPYTMTYVSDILTDQARVQAEKSVSPIYFAVDPGIARQQIERMQVVLNYVNLVRNDNYATNFQKLDDLSHVTELNLSEESMQQILTLPQSGWQTIQQECVIVLEQVMRNRIREDQLGEALQQVPRIISYTLSESLAALVNELVTPLIVPNSLYNDVATESAIQTARESVESIKRTYVAGETIINRGQIITSIIWEALEQYNLLQTEDTMREMLSTGIFTILVCFILAQFFHTQENTPLDQTLGLILILTYFILYLGIGRIAIPGHTVLPYIIPIAAYALTISGIYSPSISLISTLFLSLLTAFDLSISLELTIFYLLTSFVGVIILGRGQRIANFGATSIMIGVIGALTTFSYQLPLVNTDWFGLITLAGASFLNGIAAASIALLMRFAFGKALNIMTPLQLLDLSRPDHPLLQLLLRNAPGTYQHSLQVANLAEQAAEVIGADALLTRVGALFHDIGKAESPRFFIENQIPGQANPHDSLTPIESSKIITNHITAGIRLAEKYKLPKQIIDFIAEHQGTMVTRYQYITMLQTVDDPDQVNMRDFQYPGPTPQRKETALVMLADGCEARFRADMPESEEELRNLIGSQIENGINDGQFDYCDLTMRDFENIKESFVQTLKTMHHIRIKYPTMKPREKSPKELVEKSS